MQGKCIYGHNQLAHHSAIRAMGGCRIICVHERAVGIYMYRSHIYAKPGADTPREFHHMYILLSARHVNAIVAEMKLDGPFGSRVRVSKL